MSGPGHAVCFYRAARAVARLSGRRPLHLLRGILPHLSRLRDGNAARVDARAARDGDVGVTGYAPAHREADIMTARARAPLIVVAAGGTAGHLFPAEALACALTQRGIAVDLATDVRVARYRQSFPARQIHVIPSETLRGRNPLRLATTAAW